MISEKPKLPKNAKLTQLANTLRKNATKEEKHLWYDYLRCCNVKFHRQIVIGNYIVDFFCPKAGLIVELDGSQHYKTSNIKRDKIRTEYIESLGFVVLRFTNTEINRRFSSVCQKIQETVDSRTKSLLPRGEGGTQTK